MINITEWSKISADAFKSMQFDSGILVKSFNPASSDPPAESDILCETSGAITVSLSPSINDLGEDVNNLHGRYKELLYLASWEATMSFTALNMTPEVLKLALGAADITSGSGKVTPRMYIDLTDFGDVTWVGMRLDGGLVAATMKNAFGTAGLAISANKDGKGTLGVTLTGHMSMATQGDVPMEFYSIASA